LMRLITTALSPAIATTSKLPVGLAVFSPSCLTSLILHNSS
jgi:hypothetical protein